MIDPQQWVSRHTLYLNKIAARKINDRDQAQDLIQDTFLAALERQHQFRGESSERTWLTSILLNKIFDLYRKNSLEKAKHELIVNAQIKQQTGQSYEERLHYKEFLRVMDSNLLRLPKLWSAVFRMNYLDDRPADEICSQLGITASNFWTITHRTKMQLRHYLRQAGNTKTK